VHAARQLWSWLIFDVRQKGNFMNPTPEEIRNALPAHDPEDQIVFIDENDAMSADLIESLVIRLRNFTVKLFRWPKIKKVIFVVVLGLSALDGIQVHVPQDSERVAITQIYEQSQVWIQNVATYSTPQNRNQYFVLGSAGEPSPTEEIFAKPETVAFAPISGSAIQNYAGNFQVYRPTA
jgi:hypothetical protein